MSWPHVYQIRGQILRKNHPVRSFILAHPAASRDAARVYFQRCDVFEVLRNAGIRVEPGCTVKLHYRAVGFYRPRSDGDINLLCNTEDLRVVRISPAEDAFPEQIVLGQGHNTATYQRVRDTPKP